MVMPRIDVNEDTVIKARRLYETTQVPVPDIALMLGISERTLHKRRAEWGWEMRRDRALAMRQRLADAATVVAAMPDPVPDPIIIQASEAQASGRTLDQATLIRGIRNTVEREIAAVELHLNLVSPGAPRSHAGERAARTLATLVRTLNELKRLEKEDADAHDEAPRDIDALREALAEKLEQLKREVKGTAPLQPRPRRHRSPR